MRAAELRSLFRTDCETVIESTFVRSARWYQGLGDDAPVFGVQDREELPVSRICHQDIPFVGAENHIGWKAADLDLLPGGSDLLPGRQRNRISVYGQPAACRNTEDRRDDDR